MAKTKIKKIHQLVLPPNKLAYRVKKREIQYIMCKPGTDAAWKYGELADVDGALAVKASRYACDTVGTRAEGIPSKRLDWMTPSLGCIKTDKIGVIKPDYEMIEVHFDANKVTFDFCIGDIYASGDGLSVIDGVTPDKGRLMILVKDLNNTIDKAFLDAEMLAGLIISGTITLRHAASAENRTGAKAVMKYGDIRKRMKSLSRKAMIAGEMLSDKPMTEE